MSYLSAYEHRAGERNKSITNRAGKGDSSLSAFLASKKAAIAAGMLAEDAIDLEVLKVGFRLSADALPAALGGAHCLGLWAELYGIIEVWKYATCLNRDPNPLKLPGEGWDSESQPHNVAKEAERRALEAEKAAKRPDATEAEVKAAEAARAAATAAWARADEYALHRSESHPHNVAKEAERRAREAETAANREGASEADKAAAAAARATATAARARADEDALHKSESHLHSIAKEAERRAREAEKAATQDGATEAQVRAAPAARAAARAARERADEDAHRNRGGKLRANLTREASEAERTAREATERAEQKGSGLVEKESAASAVAVALAARERATNPDLQTPTKVSRCNRRSLEEGKG